MGLPWIQVDKGFPRSPEAVALAHHLCVTRQHAVGLCNEFWAWAADHAEDGRIDGPLASLVIDDAMAPGFGEAMLKAGLLEKDDAGFRIVGWGRYAKALEKGSKDAERKRARRASGALSARAVPEDGRAFGAGKSQMKSQSQNKPPSEVCADAPPAADFKLTGEPEPKKKKRSEGQEFWDWAQAERTKATGLVREAEPDNAKLNTWFKSAISELGGEKRLEVALIRYTHKPLDDYWVKRGLPFNGFIAKWRDYAPPEEAAA